MLVHRQSLSSIGDASPSIRACLCACREIQEAAASVSGIGSMLTEVFYTPVSTADVSAVGATAAPGQGTGSKTNEG